MDHSFLDQPVSRFDWSIEMNFELIKKEAESFFEWPGEKRTDIVTLTSCLLFAKHCVEKSQQWRPIEEAPKDESVIHLCLPLNKRFPDDRRVYEGRWCAAQNACTSVNGFSLLNNATHYRPLPPAPEAA